MGLELHCWGNQNEYASFDPESLAAIWLLALSAIEFTIVPSSNMFIAELPFLRDDNNTVSGFNSIVLYLKERFDLDSNLNEEQKLVNEGLKTLIEEKINPITQYVLFMNKENYEEYSRGMFKDLLPFPMQYAPPLEMKHSAERICANFGLTLDNGVLITEDDNRYRELLETEKQLRNTPTMGSLHSAQKRKTLAEFLQKKSTISNMRAINLFETYMQQIADLKHELGTDDAQYIFGDTISTSDLLLFAHLTSQTLPQLPNSFIKVATEFKYPSLLENLATFKKFVDRSLDNIKVLPPSADDYPSLLNYAKLKVRSII